MAVLLPQQQIGGAAANGEYDDQTGIHWRDDNYPHASLTRFTALHYFELSPFFDPASNNTLARQQGRDPAIIGALEFVAPAGGTEYVVELEQPPHLFVVHKRLRRGVDTSLPNSVTLLAIYYILDKNIYQAPSLHQVLTSRLRRCIWGLHQGFAKLQADLDPMVRIAKEQQQQQQPLEMLDIDTPQSGPGLAAEGSLDRSSPDAVLMAVEAAEAGVAGVPDIGKALQPLPLPKRIPPEEAAYWTRTDNIILTVLNGYKVPELPLVHQQHAQAMQQQQPPIPHDAVQPGQGQQVQQVQGQGQAAAQQAGIGANSRDVPMAGGIGDEVKQASLRAAGQGQVTGTKRARKG